MGFKIKNSLTGEFEKLPILTLKGEKGETGGVEEYNKVDYMGNKYETLKQANDANVEYAVKTAIGEFNYLDYDGQHITATDSIEGRSKSAILSGNTLVNLLDSTSFKRNHGSWATTTTYDSTSRIFTLNLGANSGTSWNIDLLGMNSSLKEKLVDGKTYTVSINIIKNSNMNNFKIFGQHISSSSLGTINIVFTYNSSSHLSVFGYNDSNSTDSPRELKIIYNALVDGDYSDANIPYFEGIQSVKMPVLKTTGKNLFNGEVDKGYINDAGADSWSTDWIRTDYFPVEANTDYYFSVSPPFNNANLRHAYLYDENKKYLFRTNQSNKFRPSVNGFVRCVSQLNGGGTVSDDQASCAFFQIAYGTDVSPYEPYKSNILTVNEPVELRGIGDVQDELNCLTGELTQRVSGLECINQNSKLSQSGTSNDTTLVITISIKSTSTSGKRKLVASHELLKYAQLDHWYGNLSIIFRLPKSNENFATLANFKQYLTQNPFYYYRELEQNEISIKTVDLSDNHVYSYKGTTHYDCSSAEGSLVPTLSVKVPTDVQATIAQQRETIQTLNSENERLNQIQEALKASMLDSQVQLMNLSWNTDFEVFTLRESIAPKDFLLDSRTGSNIDKFSQAKFIIENDCPDLEKLNSQIEYYFSKDVFSQEQFEELTDLISIVKGENGCEY